MTVASPTSAIERPPASLAPIGYMLIAVLLLAAFAMLHHPVAYGQHGADVLASIRKQGMADELVHGAMILVFGVITVAMYLFSMALGASRFVVLAALIAFSSGFIMILLAATTDGFVIPAIAFACPSGSASTCAADSLVLLRLCGLEVELFTRVAFCAIGLAIFAWGISLLTTAARPLQWAGVAGVVLGLTQIVLLLISQSRFSPETVSIAATAQVAWYAIVAALMIQNSLTSPLKARIV